MDVPADGNNLRPALFLDRDGVINVDRGYVVRPEDFEFIDGIFTLVQAARNSGHAVVVITNQAGIGRGYYSEYQFETLTRWMCAEFERRGAGIDRVYHSPTHPVHGIGAYRREDVMRKPNPGMILRARDELNLDLPQSILVGDKLSDIEAGLSAGVGCNLWFNTAEIDAPERCARVASLLDAVPYLKAAPESGA